MEATSTPRSGTAGSRSDFPTTRRGACENTGRRCSPAATPTGPRTTKLASKTMLRPWHMAHEWYTPAPVVVRWVLSLPHTVAGEVERWIEEKQL